MGKDTGMGEKAKEADAGGKATDTASTRVSVLAAGDGGGYGDMWVEDLPNTPGSVTRPSGTGLQGIQP